jgi:serine/threonine protein phosphatase PrpC
VIQLGQTASITDPGRRRRRNEDAFVCEPPLFAVADGMGGAQAGEIASRLAATAVQGGPAGDVVELIQEANRRVWERSAEDEAVSGMGTTMTVALVDADVVRIGHVGDSRAYLIREGTLAQLTEDHSLVAELVRSGKLSPEEAEVHPQRSVITRALGTEREVDVDAFSVPARTGDVFMLCSDGLTGMVADETILDLVGRNRAQLQAAAKALVDAANRQGGEDNITLVLFEIADAAGDTATMPALDLPVDDPDEQATLTEADGVPVVEAPPPEPVRRRAVRPQRRRRAAAIAAIVLGLVAIVVVGGLYALSRAHFVGAESDGRVAIYQGVPWNLPFGIHLYRVKYVSPLVAAQLSQSERRKLFDHDLHSYSSDLAAVRAYEAQAP